MKQVTHDELRVNLLHHYNKKIALFVYGRFGIGKSDTVQFVANQIAEQKGRKFVNWNKLSEEEKKQVFDNPKDYFTLIDIRLSEYDSSDIKGLPIFKTDNKAIEFKVPFWALLTTKADSDGILFFDEINLAPPLVMSSCYKIIYDRVINDMPINSSWGVFGAGNLDEDRAYTNSMAPPLKDRASEVELVGASSDKWSAWAMEHNIEPRIIGFISFKNQALYKVDFNDKQKFTTHRGWERVSTLIKGIEDDYSTMELLSSSAIGEGIAKEFVAFCKISQEIDLPGILNNPERIKTINELSVKWFINTAIAEQYANNKIKFDKVMGVSKALDEIDNVELVAYLWKMCNGLSKSFKKEFLKSVDDNLVKKYQKYLI
jgi:hypothetical protein